MGPGARSWRADGLKAKSRGAVPLMRKRAEWSWRRWESILSRAAARAVASSLLELPRTSGADGEVPPQHEVERDLHLAGRLQ